LLSEIDLVTDDAANIHLPQLSGQIRSYLRTDLAPSKGFVFSTRTNFRPYCLEFWANSSAESRRQIDNSCQSCKRGVPPCLEVHDQYGRPILFYVGTASNVYSAVISKEDFIPQRHWVARQICEFSAWPKNVALR